MTMALTSTSVGLTLATITFSLVWSWHTISVLCGSFSFWRFSGHSRPLVDWNSWVCRSVSWTFSKRSFFSLLFCLLRAFFQPLTCFISTQLAIFCNGLMSFLTSRWVLMVYALHWYMIYLSRLMALTHSYASKFLFYLKSNLQVSWEIRRLIPKRQEEQRN
jgi:hypothetical protein